MRTLFRNVSVEGRPCDVLLGPMLVEAVGDLTGRTADEVIDGRGAALIPGLHDHHLHLLATAAARVSVDCSASLEALRTAAPEGWWIRGTHARESVDRHRLDELVPHRPVRVQHRSGSLWMLNTPALDEVREILTGPDVERDDRGVPTGRLWRFDRQLRSALPSVEQEIRPALSAFVSDLTSLGITSVTDATPDLDPHVSAELYGLPIGVTLLGDPDGDAPWKILLRDHDLPAVDALAARIAAVHRQGRAVAVHCVSRESLFLTLAALDDSGPIDGDRIEHAGVVPHEARSRLERLIVVTQPAMLVARSDDYRTDVDPNDLDCLYPHASLLGAGVRTWLSSDSPYGPADPWAVLRSARDRELVPSERVPVDQAVASMFLDAFGRSRRVVPGDPAAVCLLSVAWDDMLNDPDADAVRLVRASTRPAAAISSD